MQTSMKLHTSDVSTLRVEWGEFSADVRVGTCACEDEESETADDRIIRGMM
jgi:hypothetical protein